MKRLLRRGFTLFQLLVLLALIGILLGLLLPAIAKVRAAANRSQSMNNMKQIGLACHNYHDTHAAMPPGMDANGFSAAAHMLPYIEQNALYQLINFKKQSTDRDNETPRRTAIKTFLSPLDPQPLLVVDSAPTNYLFNAGSKPALEKNDGIFFQNSKLKFQDVTDGLSNTLMTGETLRGDGSRKATDVRRQYVALASDALKSLDDESGVQEFKDDTKIAGDRCAAWMDGRFLQGTFTGTRQANDARPDVSCDGRGGLSGLRGMMDTVIVGISDGSVRGVRTTLGLDVWKNLAARNDGSTIPDF